MTIVSTDPKVIFLYDDRLPYQIGIFRYTMYTFSGKEKVVYNICIADQHNKQNLKYVTEYGHTIPSSIGSALFRYFNDRVEDVYQNA